MEIKKDQLVLRLTPNSEDIFACQVNNGKEQPVNILPILFKPSHPTYVRVELPDQIVYATEVIVIIQKPPTQYANVEYRPPGHKVFEAGQEKQGTSFEVSE